MVLCRQCVQYVFEGTLICPHCGRDATEIGPRYKDEYLAVETINRVDRALAKLRMQKSGSASDSAAQDQ
jgi:uncharacterized Zn finger protein (UPF0148 family)